MEDKNTMQKLVKHCTFISLLCSFSVCSQWYETQGHARTNETSIEIARTKAVENALKKALLVSGASVSSVQQVVNGLLTQDQISIRASGSVNSIELVDEIHSDNLITVTIRADIFPQEKKCFAVNFKKSVLITRSKLVHRDQANIGEIYSIDKAVMKKFSKQIDEESTYTKTSNIIDNKTGFSRLNNSLSSQKISTLTQTLSDRTNSQYVMFSEITNLSFNQKSINGWQFWQQGIYQRDFGLTVYLYNGLNGEQVWKKDYNNSAPWAFSKRTIVDPTSTIFWKSEYGLMVEETLNKVIKDIDENIMCEPSRGKILKVQGNQVTIDLGRDNGLKIGDEFSLLHLNHFTSNKGKAYTGFSVSPYKVKVTKLSTEIATAETPDGRLFGNIQVDDIAVRYENE